MPISIRWDPERNVTYGTATGVVTDADLLDLCTRLLSDPRYDPSLDHILDTQGIERLEVSAAAVQEAAHLFARADGAIAAGARPKIAIVAPADFTFGVARMYEAYRGMRPSPKRYLVCRTMEEARRWLGLPVDQIATGPEDGGDSPRVVPVEFRDARGVQWTVAPRLVGSGTDVVPHGFLFSSEQGERRFLEWNPQHFFSPREVDHATWRELLRAATIVT